MKGVHSMKVEIESRLKTQAAIKLELENVGNLTHTSVVSLSSRVQNREKWILGVDDRVEKKNQKNKQTNKQKKPQSKKVLNLNKTKQNKLKHKTSRKSRTL